ncbi:hypothetical protein HYPSUDRAFT_210023 [Hypholoma sublateritium FD-334 SS-4]|uniref:Uncharacterized protein n=1 Tax=Hypholoma sublateritium (strain FD-334 SS-4) TaxID=945553 RepID=A0A0D2NWF7_HYPSF|nr:hypothetical protein HYPSUDRAFT_210023 [Hypholoma sublateritium FD-334 SS-4]
MPSSSPAEVSHFICNDIGQPYTSPTVLQQPQLPLADRMILFQNNVCCFGAYFGVWGSQESIDACEKLLTAAISLAVPLDLLAWDADMIYSITDLLRMHSSILVHYASQQGLPPPDLGDLHYTLRRSLSLALDRAYAVRTNADVHYRKLLIAASAEAREASTSPPPL